MDFETFLNSIGEVGVVDEIKSAVVFVSGLPKASPREIILFEDGSTGQVLSLSEDYVEVLMLTHPTFPIGTKAARTDRVLSIPVDTGLLGHIVDPLGNGDYKEMPKERRPVDSEPPGIVDRKRVTGNLETGMPIIDLIVPIGKGQRELVIGDRKTGKTSFVLHAMINHAKKEKAMCIYACIGKKRSDVFSAVSSFQKEKVLEKMVVVNSSSSDPPGLIFLAPYAAMTIAEYFRDAGYDVLIVLDDLSAHARAYRELTLLSGRFPGRNSYPGDVFYIHSKLLERAGSFKNGTITCLPVVDSIQGDLSGFIQTNVMAITDGHVYIDIELFNKGLRPSINPFLSVTRVGRQTQSQVAKDASRIITSFMVQLKRLRQLMHFGAELNEQVKMTLALGDRLDLFFYRFNGSSVPVNATVYIVALLWSGFGRDMKENDVKSQIEKEISEYMTNEIFKTKIDRLVEGATSFDDLYTKIAKELYAQQSAKRL